MTEGRKCCVYLPNERKLELVVQPKLLGRDLLDIVAAHFKLKEKDYFGIAYKSDAGHYLWLQEDKRILEHDIIKKSNFKLEFQFAVKFYVESVAQLKQSLTIELFFLQVKSLIYKGQFEVESTFVFKLAAYVMQITYGDYTDDNSAVHHLRKLPVLPNKILQEHSAKDCETNVVTLYKELKGKSKGKCILNYMICAESLPTYGIHYYKVKDKSGIPWWLGLNFKGIFQFDFHDRRSPAKAYHWRQLENLYFREKKFSIEVCERIQRRSSAGSKATLSVEPRKKPAEEVKVYAWYGSPGLIKSIWIMSIAQHHYYLDRKQSKLKLKGVGSLSSLSNDLSNNSHSLITTRKDTPVMTQKQIKDVDVTVKKGSKDETPEVRAAKREMAEALRVRRTELEDRLYDKVQELKRICLQEAEIIGKLPPEYVRYMDLNEKPPKIKKRVGAEFKVKLRNKPANDREYPTTVTAASSSSSGFGSEAIDLSDELSQLEQEFEILTQIANAAKKLASDSHAKGRTRTRRMNSYKKAVDKLQVVEEKINVLRKKSGQRPTVRVSMLITEDDLMFEDGATSLGGGTESERSSLSDGMLLDDDTSLSSGGDVLSTHSTPAVLGQTQPRVGSAMMSRKNISPCDVDISDLHKRSLTPPPSFERPSIDSSVAMLKKNGGQYPLIPSPRSSSGVFSMDSNQSESSSHVTRNWISKKWEVPRPKPTRGWHESSLDSLDTMSSASRQSEDARSTEQHDLDYSHRNTDNTHAVNVADTRLQSRKASDSQQSDRPASANSNQNNHNEIVAASKNSRDVYNMTKLKRDVSDSALSELSVKSNPINLPSVAEKDGASSESLPKILENPPKDSFRKRSSSFTEAPNRHIQPPHRSGHKNKTGTLKSNYQPQYLPSPQLDTYNVQQAFASRARQEGDVSCGITKSRSSHELKPPIFDTNVNIRMQYLNRSNGHLSYAAPTAGTSWNQNVPGTRYSQPGVLESEMRSEPPSTRAAYAAPNSGQSFQHPPSSAAGSGYYNPVVHTQLPQAYGDPYLGQGYPHYYSQHHTYNQGYQDPSALGPMSLAQRDMLNNEVYQDIGMGWIPTMNEYSSRASVCESASAQSKKEDILRVLVDHIAEKRTPSVSSSQMSDKNHYAKKRRLREQYLAFQPQQTYPNQSGQSRDKTWADYQKQPAYAIGDPQDRSVCLSQNRSAPTLNETNPPSRTNLFHHKPPPSPAKEPPLLYKTQRQPRVPQHKPTASSSAHQKPPHGYNTSHHTGRTNSTNQLHGWHGNHELKQRILLEHYLHHDHGSDPLDHVHAVKSRHEQQQPELQRQDHVDYGLQNDQRFYPLSIAPSDGHQYRQTSSHWMSQSSGSKQDERHPTDPAAHGSGLHQASRPKQSEERNKTQDPGPVVIQALTKSPEGHDVSMFTVTKSAPNTPLPKRGCGSSFFPLSSSSSDDEEYHADASKGTIKRHPEIGYRRPSADDLLCAPQEEQERIESTHHKPPSIIIHTPGIKTRVKPAAEHPEKNNFNSERTTQQMIHRQFSNHPPLNHHPPTSLAERRSERERVKASMASPDHPPPPPPRTKQTSLRSKSNDAEIRNFSKPGLSVTTSKTLYQKASSRGTPVLSESDKLRPPPPAYPPNCSTPIPSRKAFGHEPPLRKSTSSPTVSQMHCGTLPRASKSRRRLDRGDHVPSTTEHLPATPLKVHHGDKKRDRDYRRNSIVGYQAHSTFDSSVGSAVPKMTPRKLPPTCNRGTPAPRLSPQFRSKSEAWKGREIQSSRATPQPINFDGSGRFQGVSDWQPNPHPSRHTGEQKRAYYNKTPTMSREKLSASAEDLLWTENSDNQAGTLV